MQKRVKKDYSLFPVPNPENLKKFGKIFANLKSGQKLMTSAVELVDITKINAKFSYFFSQTIENCSHLSYPCLKRLYSQDSKNQGAKARSLLQVCRTFEGSSLEIV
jgi:hypothetical protein